MQPLGAARQNEMELFDFIEDIKLTPVSNIELKDKKHKVKSHKHKVEDSEEEKIPSRPHKHRNKEEVKEKIREEVPAKPKEKVKELAISAAKDKVKIPEDGQHGKAKPAKEKKKRQKVLA